MTQDEKIEFLKQKQKYMANCIDKIILSVETGSNLETQGALRAMQIHLNEITGFVKNEKI